VASTKVNPVVRVVSFAHLVPFHLRIKGLALVAIQEPMPLQANRNVQFVNLANFPTLAVRLAPSARMASFPPITRSDAKYVEPASMQKVEMPLALRVKLLSSPRLAANIVNLALLVRCRHRTEVHAQFAKQAVMPVRANHNVPAARPADSLIMVVQFAPFATLATLRTITGLVVICVKAAIMPEMVIPLAQLAKPLFSPRLAAISVYLALLVSSRMMIGVVVGLTFTLSPCSQHAQSYNFSFCIPYSGV